MPRRERRSVLAVEPVGPYTLLRLERGGIDPGTPGQFFMLEAPGRLLPRALSLCLAPAGELAFLIDPIGPGTESLCALERGDAIHVFGPLGNGYRLDVGRPLLVGGGIGMAPLPYLAESLRFPPVILGFRSQRHAEAAALLPSRCSTRSARSARAPSSPGRRRWRAATAPATAAPSRSTASSNACVWKGPFSVLLNASGCLDAILAPDVARQLDGFVTKTITPLSREGNAPPRIAETAQGMLNAIGLANPGRERFLAETLPQLRNLGVPLWISVGGFCAQDYADTCAALEDVYAIELNLSCPNVDEAADSAAEIVAACRTATTHPLYAKLSAAHPDIAAVARAVATAGADAAWRLTRARSSPCSRAAPVGCRDPHSSRSRSPPYTRATRRRLCPSSAWAA